MGKETIIHEGIKYYPLRGLDGYYGSMDGSVLSMKKGKPNLLRPSRYGNSEAFFLYISPCNIRLSRSRVVYMVQNGVEYSRLGKNPYTVLPDGRAVCTSLAELCRITTRKKDENRNRDPRKWIAEGKRMIELTEHYLDTGDMKELAVEAEKRKGYISDKLTTAFRLSRRTTIEIATEAISETIWNISQGTVVFNMTDYILIVAKRIAKISIDKRKKLVGLTYDPADRESYSDNLSEW